MEVRVKDAGESEGHLVMRRIGVCAIPGLSFAPRESEQTSSRCLTTRKHGKPFKAGKQMTVTVLTAVVSLAGAPSPVSATGDGSMCVS
jgi:hypothetical protein